MSATCSASNAVWGDDGRTEPVARNDIVGDNGGMPGTTTDRPEHLHAPTAASATPAYAAGRDPLSAMRVQYLVDAFGGAGLAAVIGVNRSQPTRWAKGDEHPGPAAAPLIIDLEHILARARLVWGDPSALTWLESPNSFLEGSRPLDVLRTAGPGIVLEALDAEEWGGAA